MKGCSPSLGPGVLAEGVVLMFNQASWACSGIFISASCAAVDRDNIVAPLEYTRSFSRTFSDGHRADAMTAGEDLPPQRMWEPSFRRPSSA